MKSMRFAFRHLYRSPIQTVLFIVLLAIACGLLCLSASLRAVSHTNMAEINDLYTTIAIPNIAAINNKAQLTSLGEEDAFWEGTGMEESIKRARIYEQISIAGQGLNSAAPDSRRFYRGHWPGLTMPLSGYNDPLEYVSLLDYPYNLAVLTVICEAAEELPPDNLPYENGIMHGAFNYMLTLQVEQVVHLSPMYETPKRIYAYNSNYSQNGLCPFEVGKRYLIFGEYRDVDVIWVENENPDSPVWPSHIPLLDPEGKQRIRLEEVYGIGDSLTTEDIFGQEEEWNGSVYHRYKRSEERLRRMRVELEGSLEEFLIAGDNSDIRNTIENLKRNIYAVPILATQALDSITCFNQNRMAVTEGRDFTKTETEEGARVCIISAELAKVNGLSVGDSIPFSLYDMHFIALQPPMPERYHENNLTRDEGMYVIVGIYTNLEPLDYGNISQPPLNMVIIPAAAIPPSAGEQEDIPNGNHFMINNVSYPLYYSFILPNGGGDAFLQEMEEKGVGDLFVIYDQGYSYVHELVSAVIFNINTVFMVSLIVWGFSAILFFTVYFLWQKKNVGIMRSLGANPARVFAQLFHTFLLLMLPAMLVGVIVSAVFFDSAVQRVYTPETEMLTESTNKNIQADYVKIDIIKPLETPRTTVVILLTAALQLIILLSFSASVSLLLARAKPFTLVRGTQI